MRVLDDLRAAVAEARVSNSGALAEALVALAEAEPAFKHRSQLVRALLEEAARLCDRDALSTLQGRILIRLGTLKLVEDDLEGAEQLAQRAVERLRESGAGPELTAARALSARILVRRRDFGAARSLLAELGATLPTAVAGLPARRAGVALALGIGELSLASDGENARARAIYGELVSGIASGREEEELFAEAAYHAHQALAYLGIVASDGSAVRHLREPVTLAKRYAAAADECEARIALAGALADRGDLASLEEAARHLQVARDEALQRGLSEQHVTALVGQAALMKRRGQVGGALDRCLEIARDAVGRQDPTQYLAAVVLMSEIYYQTGDLPSSYKVLAEAEQALVERFGERAKELTRPHLFALADRMGRNKFVELVDNIYKARSALETLRPTTYR
jgi:hypothetical protein